MVLIPLLLKLASNSSPTDQLMKQRMSLQTYPLSKMVDTTEF